MSGLLATSFADRSRFERRAELDRLAQDRQADLGLILGLSWITRGGQADIDYAGSLSTNKIFSGLTKLAKSVPWEVKWNSAELANESKALPSFRDALLEAAPVDLHQEDTTEERRRRKGLGKYRDFAGILSQIDTAAIASFALDIRHSRHKLIHSHDPPLLPFPRVNGPSFGSAHVFYTIEFYDATKWIIKIPANGTPDTWDKLNTEAVRAEALVLNLLKTETKVPVPEIIDADSGPHNELHVPYLMMEFVEGQPLDRVWFGDGEGEGKLGEKRIKILRGLAKAMLQLGKFEFDRGGAPVFDNEGFLVGVGPLRELDVQAMVQRWLGDEDCEREPLYTGAGSFSDVAGMYTALLNQYPSDTETGIGVDRLLRILVGLIREPEDPTSHKGKETENRRKKKRFVLTHSDLGMRNIIVSKEGDIRGILGWDGARAAPKSMGNEALPRWLVRDFNPFVWRWQPPPELWRTKSYEDEPEGNRFEDAPWVLRELRDEYAKILRGLGQENGRDADMNAGLDVTKQSLLTLNLDAAVRDPRCRVAVLRRILEKCSRASEEFDFNKIVETLGDGEQLDGYKLKCLERNLGELIDRGYVRGAVVW
ncbi:hypothetical protein F4819DRAFT_71176 [Hypoxylon fuscum]|nr:hypothetical protein F4819DRAFT_71176 [Hypoxylon fuscum]